MCCERGCVNDAAEGSLHCRLCQERLALRERAAALQASVELVRTADDLPAHPRDLPDVQDLMALVRDELDRTERRLRDLELTSVLRGGSDVDAVVRAGTSRGVT